MGRGKFAEAAQFYQQAARMYRALGNRAAESVADNNLMFVYEQLRQFQLAIFYGKQAVNLTQQLRAEITGLDQETQTSFLQSRKDIYRKLADLLIAGGRLTEARAILEMLKEEETVDFVRRDSKEIEQLEKRPDLRPDEKAALKSYLTFADDVTKIGGEVAALEAEQKRLGAQFTGQAALKAKFAQLETANKAFGVFLTKGLAAELSTQNITEIKKDRALQGNLQEWGGGTVALYTVVTANRYRVILTTPNNQIDAKYEISAAELNTKIFAFLEALQNPRVDPRALGKELYDILIKPVEKELVIAGAKTLIWSLDGTLRYIPLAALSPDGETYLVEKYQNVIVTSTTRDSLKGEVDKNWRVLGAGVTKESEVTEPFGTKKIQFGALPGVGREIESVASNAAARMLDPQFGREAFEEQLNASEPNADGKQQRKYNVVHFATHFRLGSDDITSFLLLGDNQTLTLDDISNSDGLKFNHIELVTLSACDTGTVINAKPKSGAPAAATAVDKEKLTANNGKEVDSMAAFIENRGAKAILATLWKVADESTQLLMTEFYRLRREQPTLTKAQAMQQAQQAMIAGKLQPSTADALRRAEIVRNNNPNAPSFPFDAAKQYSHPYFWSPFVLIGNWR